jgi:hypothetical protein
MADHDEAQTIEHHRFDGFASGEVSRLRVLLHRLSDDITNAEFVEQGGD